MSDWFSGVGDWLSGAGNWLGKNANWLLPAAAGIGSTIYGANAQQSATQTQSSALQAAQAAQSQQADNSLNFLRYAYDTSRGDQAPYRQAGQQALGMLTPQVTGQFQETPGYRFAFDQGVQALDRSAASRGLLNSGAQARALTRYGQGVANQEYGNYLNRLSALAGTGQTATQASGQAAQAYGQGAAGVSQNLGAGLAANIGQQGLVNAQGQTGAANAYMGGANSLLSYFAGNPGIFK